MKFLKKYALLIMIVITGLGYGGFKLVTTVQDHQQKEDVDSQMEEQPDVAVDDKNEDESQANVPQTDASEEINGQPESSEQEQPQPEVPQEDPPVEEETKREFHRVEMDYLDDALFIGDSRTDTLYQYAGWEGPDFFVKTGVNIWAILDATMDGQYLMDVLSQKQYGKIYIMLGVNELGTGTPETFVAQYASVIEKIREKQPDAVIFIQSIVHVSTSVHNQGGAVNNTEIDIRNAALSQLADQENIFWLDINEVMDAPGTGALNSEYSFDGIHLEAKYIELWREYLLNHGI